MVSSYLVLTHATTEIIIISNITKIGKTALYNCNALQTLILMVLNLNLLKKCNTSSPKICCYTM